jgi:hypothetical protein
MTQYAYFNSAVSAPSPVLGWYDTGAFTYTNLPASTDLLVLTSAQWTARLNGLWAVSNGTLIAFTPPAPSLASQAQAALTAMDSPGGCAIRCFKAGVAFPAAWLAYCVALRSIVNGTASPMPTALPTAPAFPAGT